ncbi:hypothetical protein KHA94_13940 [Bacillus sp. FJAT-49705]|uniref:YqgU-like 6-bladed beta-propeller domain-containing protein n=1 Tax=Cytobacillus citreus TaxID=2833586 RepID=A0ABS5NUN8_9BACI|nr:hypothetical protein [Cytobacillus citreus]MBS4191286.1 hypothetical protein [Cytobacillus citreus]
MEQRKNSSIRMFLFLCTIPLIILFGCQHEKDVGVQPVKKHNHSLGKEAIPHSFISNEIMTPIPIENGQFNTIYGWLNNETIIYMTNVGLGSNVYTYNVFTGDSSLIFESEVPISSVVPSPSGNYILIHSAPSTYEGIISIINPKGEQLMSERISAYEFAFEWNPYDENLMLISAFAENWDFSMFQMNIKEKKFDEIHNKEPFVNWIGKDEIIYLNWDQKDVSLFAPLVKKSINEQNEKMLLEDVYYAKAAKDLIMTITVNSSASDEAVYTFLSKDLQELSSFTVPHLTRYSDWLVPYFDFDAENQLFTLQPLLSTEADLYRDGFQLWSFDAVKGEKEMVMENLKNEPLNCSPDGKYCLYGFNFEKLIDIQSKKVLPLIKDF